MPPPPDSRLGCIRMRRCWAMPPRAGVGRRVHVLSAVSVALSFLGVSSGSAVVRPVLVSDAAIAGVRFGSSRAESVTELTRLLGRPSRRMSNSGCGRRYTEVAWGHLYVEFRDGRLSGFRYMQGAWLPRKRPPRPTPLSLLRPKVATGKGISLGSTLGRLRSAYGRLNLVGTDRWQTRDGLIFYDDARRDPPQPSSRIIEIKYGTCGDF